MPVIRHVPNIATCRAEGVQNDTHTISDGALAWSEGRFAWIGPDKELPDRFRDWDVVRAQGDLIVPGLVDCHTHLAFGGWRADEFAERAGGRTYLEIAKAGGGILRTVADTRATSNEAMVSRALRFIEEMRALGVTTVECKSGYGLTVEDEIRLLEVYRDIASEQPVRIVATLLGAHTLPPEYKDDRKAYVKLVIEEMIPRTAAEGLATFCDVFVEDSAFTPDEARGILDAAREHGLGIRLHADQLSEGGGAALAAEVGAASADHLEHASDAGIDAMARSGTVAVALPLASVYTRQPPVDARRFIRAGVDVAVATDFNPGSAPSYHLPMAMTLAATMLGMTPAEALKGATIVAARSLGLDGDVGSIEVGKAADFAVIDAPDVNHWLYHLRGNACLGTFIAGEN